MTARIQMTMEVNGVAERLVVEGRTTLLDALRENLGLTGTRHGCDEGVCGACIVHVDGEPVLSCLMFAAQAHGREIVTVEGLGGPDAPGPVQRAFVEAGAIGCGFCTAGRIMLIAGAIARAPEIADADLLRLASANGCGCLAAEPVVAAMRAAAAAALRSPAE